MNPYKELSIWFAATDEEIRLAFTLAMREAHPDKGGEHDAAARLNLAYRVIRTADGRKRHRAGLEVTGAKTCPVCMGRGRMTKRFKPVACAECEGGGMV